MSAAELMWQAVPPSTIAGTDFTSPFPPPPIAEANATVAIETDSGQGPFSHLQPLAGPLALDRIRVGIVSEAKPGDRLFKP